MRCGIMRSAGSMRYEDYTADAICQAMGLTGFVERSWMLSDRPTIRVVLTPSFNPELCITLFKSPDSTLLTVFALIDQFWAQRSQVYMPRLREDIHLSPSVFDEALALFLAAHGSFDPERRYICLDGMGSESCTVSRATTKRMRAHVATHAGGWKTSGAVD